MILQTAHNRTAAAPEFPDYRGLEAKYEQWEGRDDDTPFYRFIVGCTREREEFLRGVERRVRVDEAGLVHDTYF